MIRASVRAWLFVAACVPAGLAAAQTPAPGPADEDLLAHVGTWDAEITHWDYGRRPRVSRALEINTLGCNGTCVITKVERGTVPSGIGPFPNNRSAFAPSERRPIEPVQGVGQGRLSENLIQEAAPGDVLRWIPEQQRPSPLTQLVAGRPAPRTSFEYPSDGVRIVTLYGFDPKTKKEVPVTRVVYTRRAAAAQTPPPQAGTTTPVRLEDVGTWDAEITWWDRGQPRKAEGVEVNALGCDGTCLITTLKGGLLPRQARPAGTVASPTTAEGRALMVPVGGVGQTPSHGASHGPNNGWEEFQSAPQSFVRSFQGRFPPERRAEMLAARIRTTRTSIEYPDADHRIATLYAPGADGQDVPSARIVYARRK